MVVFSCTYGHCNVLFVSLLQISALILLSVVLRRTLGLHLRVKYGALKAIEADYRKVKQCMREMLAAWLKGQGGECTKHTLRTALLNIDYRVL